ncbi:SecY protein [Plesiocystis pacifica SIR-1]|uniref:Protein translocase subunit SecY n=1 Tax=Plesiocystis pacifica SIR-1 TaxID=391625 RepID=A6GCG0_9BACT|nr:preprotein translocase subunit SecY [Plesiocystis pacifica]EDM76417.1 SecY protein [Plesiocystis pacifica SIR-1]
MGVIINIFKLPELRRRVLFTLAMLAVYRFGIFVAVPGVDRTVMDKLVSQQTGGFLGYFNMFSGGALSNLSVFALGIMPYISASIIMQLMTVVIPKLEQLQKEGETGRRKINQYSRYGTVGLALVQGYFMASWLEGQNTPGQTLVLETGLPFKLMTMLSLTAGTCFLMWLGEQITERGIGNGISLIIFAGIIADMPTASYQLAQKAIDDPENFGPLPLAMLLVVVLVVIAFVVIMERGQRRIPVIYAKRVVGKRMFGGSQNYLPLRINNAGVIPPIFASSIIMFPAQIAGMTGNPYLQRFAAAFSYGNWLYLTVYVALCIFFCYFYTQIQFNPVDLADNLKKQNASIPGVRPGKRTAEHIEAILGRLTFAGSWYISAVCVLPVFLQTEFNVPFYYGGTSLLIVVGVALDTAQQIESHLVTRSYEGFAGPKGPRIRGRKN